MNKNNKTIEECYIKSLELLKKNSTPFGVLASSASRRAEERNYLSIFGRDAAICALGMMASGDKKLASIAKKSLDTLGRYQAPNGQIPNSVKPEAGTSSFWTLGCIDATLWWLIAKFFSKKYISGKNDKKIRFKEKSAIDWLLCQEHQGDGLLIQTEASDWADIMPRNGRVLYTNALWHAVKKLYQTQNASLTKKNCNLCFYPFDKKLSTIKQNIKTIKRITENCRPENFFLSFVSYMYWGRDIDVLANSLAIIFGLADKNFSKKIVAKVLSERKRADFPVPVMYRPIKKDSKLWRPYMKNHNQNFPYQYHNGGIWPFASCFWAMALRKAGYEKLAWEEMEKIAEANKLGNWKFKEWLNGKTGQPMGMAGQSWNAGAFLLACHYLRGEVEI